MPATTTSISSWAKAIKKALDNAGCDSLSLLREAGLDERSLDDPDARYPLDKTARLWRLAVQATGNASFGLKVASQVGQSTFHALGHTLSVSTTLKDAFERVVRYFRLVSDAAELEFRQQGDEYHFIMQVRAGRVQPALEALDAFTSVLVRTCRSLAGRDFTPLRIELKRPTPADTAEFEAVLRAPLVFGAAENRIVFDAPTMERTLDGANPELAHYFDEIALKYLARFDKDNILARVKTALIERLADGEPSQDDIARRLGLSARSLQRRLAEEYTTYKELLDGTRHELALSYLKNPGYSISEITYLLGFSDTSSFTRAFRRWTGMPPMAYRRELDPGHLALAPEDKKLAAKAMRH